MMTIARTKEELDAYVRGACGDPDCKVKHKAIFMCDEHLEAPVLVFYKQGTGVIDIRCSVCNQPVAELELASCERALSA